MCNTRAEVPLDKRFLVAAAYYVLSEDVESPGAYFPRQWQDVYATGAIEYTPMSGGQPLSL